MIGPRWWFFGAHPKTGAVTMLAEATPKLGESHARVLGHLLADDTKMRLQIHSPKGKAPLANPALRLPAGDHVAYPRWTVYEPAAGYLVATLSGLLSAAQAKKAAKNLATWLGFPVAVVEEFHGGKSNPGTPDPVRGERWARRGGGSAAEVVEVKRPKVHIKAGGKHDWPIIQDFKADYRPPAGRLPNPKRRITADSWRNLSDYEVDRVAHSGNLKATRTAAKRELARRGVKWTGEGVADRVMGRTNPKRHNARKPSMLEAGYEFVRNDGRGVIIVSEIVSGGLERWVANKGHASFGFHYRGTDWEFASSKVDNPSRSYTARVARSTGRSKRSSIQRQAAAKYRAMTTRSNPRGGRRFDVGESVIYRGPAWWYEREGFTNDQGVSFPNTLAGADAQRYNEPANVVRKGVSNRYLVRSANDGRLAWADSSQLELPLANPRAAGWSYVKAGEAVRVTNGIYRGQSGTVKSGGGVALVELQDGFATWFNAENLQPHHVNEYGGRQTNPSRRKSLIKKSDRDIFVRQAESRGRMSAIVFGVPVMVTQGTSGWHYHHPDRGIVGPFSTAGQAFDEAYQAGRVPNPKRHNPKLPGKSKFIAWVDHSSVAVGPTVDAVVAAARELIHSARWQEFEPGYPEIYVTTYGAQKMVQRGISSGPESNPSFRVSGTIEEIPDATPVVRRRGPGRPRKVRVAPVELAPPLDAVPFEVPAEAPGRELQAGDRVTVPYSGRASYFGRAVKHTRESGIFEGYTYENDQRLAFVRVNRGHTVETHAFPVDQVRLHGKSFAEQAAGRRAGRPAKLARLTWKAHGSLAKAEAMLEKATADHADTEALAMELYPQHEAQPGRPRGRTEAASREYVNARAKLRRLRERVDLLGSVVRSLGGGTVALGYGEATGTDPWAANRRRYRNPTTRETQLAAQLVRQLGFDAMADDVLSGEYSVARTFQALLAMPGLAESRKILVRTALTALTRGYGSTRETAAAGRAARAAMKAEMARAARHPANRPHPNPSRPNHGAFDGPRTVRGAKRKRNPRGSERERAVRTFKLWHEFAPHRITRIKGPDRLIPRTLVKLGDIRAIDYISNKYGGRAVTYTHKTDRPRPVLATDPDGQHLHIVGGKVKITADGLIH